MSKSPENPTFSFVGYGILALALLNIVALGSNWIPPEILQQTAQEDLQATTLLIDLVAMGVGSYMTDIG